MTVAAAGRDEAEASLWGGGGGRCCLGSGEGAFEKLSPCTLAAD